MTLSKAFVTGIVTRKPEIRYTQNDLAMASMTINIDKTNETLIRVISFGQNAQNMSSLLDVGDEVAVEGRLQINSFNLPNGKEKRVYEISASSFEKMNGSTGSVTVSTQQSNVTQSVPSQEENIVSFSDSEPAEDLIDEDEIPF